MSEETIVVEYSRIQRQFHIDEIVAVVRKNRSAILNGNSIDYIPIAFCSSWAEADEAVRKFKECMRCGNGF